MQKPKSEAQQNLEQFAEEFGPLESKDSLLLLVDKLTGANFCECHIKGSTLVSLGTIDSPLDPEDQPDYRANREIRLNHPAFLKMKEDARKGRAFSNIVSEYTKGFDAAHPLKVVGGQHRFQAIQDAVANSVDEFHSVKAYFNLDMNQKIDVQLISNTNIAISGDLFDRMQETFQGPQRRDWRQSVGLLAANHDFADQYAWGGPISVRIARSFITNYFNGGKLDATMFAMTDTTPMLCVSGEHDPDWDELKLSTPGLRADKKLKGCLKRQQDGPCYLCSATTSPAVAKRTALQQYLQTFFGGSLRQMMTTLVAEASWTDEDLDALKDEIDRVRIERKKR